jgi:hypothetical protein
MEADVADYSLSTINRFWAKVDRRGPDECWPWIGATDGRRYGHLRLERSRKTRKAHIISWEIENRLSLPDGKCICHRCDNPPCVNPEHLFCGTYQDNSIDCVIKGRHRAFYDTEWQRGVRNANAALTEEQAREIIRRIEAGEPNRAIAVDFPISEGMVSRIKRGKAWAHLRA